MEEFVLQPDNTRVVMPLERVPVLPYDLILAVLSKVKPTPEFKADNRTETQRKQDRQISDYLIYQEEKRLNLLEASKAVDAMFTMISPSTYAGAATRNNGLSYWENVASGEGFDNPVSNAAFDALLGGVTGLAAIKGAAKGASKLAAKISKDLTAPLRMVADEIGMVYLGTPTKRSLREAEKLVGENAEFIDYGELRNPTLGFKTRTQLSQKAKDYGELVRSRFKAFGIDIPSNHFELIPLYKTYPLEYEDINGYIVKSNYEDLARGINDGYDWDGLHFRRLDGTLEAHVRVYPEGKAPENFDEIRKQIHEVIGHGSEEFVPERVWKEYDELPGFDKSVTKEEKRTTKFEVDEVMRDRYGSHYTEHLNPNIKEKYNQNMADDFAKTIKWVNGYGKKWIDSERNREAMRKAIPLPGLTIPFLINGLQLDYELENLLNMESPRH